MQIEWKEKMWFYIFMYYVVSDFSGARWASKGRVKIHRTRICLFADLVTNYVTVFKSKKYGGKLEVKHLRSTRENMSDTGEGSGKPLTDSEQKALDSLQSCNSELIDGGY